MEIIILKWIIIILLGLSAISTIMMIGEPREPTGKGSAVFNVILNALVIYWILAIF